MLIFFKKQNQENLATLSGRTTPRWPAGKNRNHQIPMGLKLVEARQAAVQKPCCTPPSDRPPEVWSVDVGGTTLPGLTLETAKEHTRVSCGWPDARDACKARPTIEAQGLASPHHHSPAWPHRPIKTRPSPLPFFLFTSSVSLSSFPLSLFVTFLLHSLAQSSQSISHIPLFPLCLS